MFYTVCGMTLNIQTVILLQLTEINKQLTLISGGKRYLPKTVDLQCIANARGIMFVNDLDCNTCWYDGQTFYRTRFGDGRYQPVDVAGAMRDLLNAGVSIKSL